MVYFVDRCIWNVCMDRHWKVVLGEDMLVSLIVQFHLLLVHMLGVDRAFIVA